MIPQRCLIPGCSRLARVKLRLPARNRAYNNPDKKPRYARFSWPCWEHVSQGLMELGKYMDGFDEIRAELINQTLEDPVAYNTSAPTPVPEKDPEEGPQQVRVGALQVVSRRLEEKDISPGEEWVGIVRDPTSDGPPLACARGLTSAVACTKAMEAARLVLTKRIREAESLRNDLDLLEWRFNHG